MMNYLNKKTLFCAVSLCSTIVFSQPKKYDLQSIAKTYKGEEAVMLESKDNLVIDFDKNDKIRIKNNHSHDVYFIGTNSKRYADEYISYSTFTDIANLDALLYEFDGTSFKKKKITEIVQSDNTSSSVFYDDNKSKRVVFPQVSQGSLSSLNYEEIYNDPHVMGSFYFSTFMPLKKSEVSIEFPENVSIKYKMFNDNGKIKFTEERKGKTIKYTWTAEQVDKYDRREEDFSISFYEPHIRFYISDYTEKGKKTEVLSDVNGLYKWYSSLIKDVNKEPVPELKQLVDSLCLGKKTEMDKAKAIFYWVQTNIKYVAIEAGYEGLVPHNAKDIFKNRYGDCKDMSSIQKAMYDYAGIKAHLVLIGTRDIPYTFDELPTNSVANHMIAMIELDGKHYFTDGTAYFIPVDFPSDAIQGKQALICNGDNYMLENVPIIAKERNQYIDTIKLNFNADTLKGTSVANHSGYFNFNFSIPLIRTPQNKWKESLANHFERGSNKFKLLSVSVDTINRDKDLIVRTAFSIPSYVKNAGNSYYINLNLDKNMQSDKVDTAKQQFDKKIDFKHIMNYTISLDVPKGFKVSKLPASAEFKDSEFGFKTNYSYDEKQRKIYYTIESYIDAIAIKASRFDTWNAMIKKLGEVYSQVVVLEKM